MTDHKDEPLEMTLAEGMERLAQQHMWLIPYVWSLDAPTSWEVCRRPTYDEEIFQDLLAATVGRWPTWDEAVSAALGRHVVERNDRAELVTALKVFVAKHHRWGSKMSRPDYAALVPTEDIYSLVEALAAVGEGEA